MKQNDKYIKKYIKLLKGKKNKKVISNILNRIYSDGYIDGSGDKDYNEGFYDKYIEKYRKSFESAKSEKEISKIIDILYTEGFEDGTEEAIN